MHIFTADNNQGKKVFEIDADNNKTELNEIPKSLIEISNKNIKKLKNEYNTNLLTISKWATTSDDEIENKPIISINNDNKIETGNLVGFIGIDDITMTIGSRFDEDIDKQYFFQYMLEKIFSINLVDLNTNRGDENVFDFLLFYIFPYFLNKAISQGLYKEYIKHEYNNSNIKGVIDITRHIRQNIPFIGKIAYNTKHKRA